MTLNPHQPKEQVLIEKIERILNRSTPLDNSFLWREEVATEIASLFSTTRREVLEEVETLIKDSEELDVRQFVDENIEVTSNKKMFGAIIKKDLLSSLQSLKDK